MIKNWLIQILKNGFRGIKFYNNNNNVNNKNKRDKLCKCLSKHNQMNLECVKYLLKYSDQLQSSIDKIFKEQNSGANVEDDDNDSNDSSFGTRFKMIDSPVDNHMNQRQQARVIQEYLQNYDSKYDENRYFIVHPSPIRNRNDLRDKNQNDLTHHGYAESKLNKIFNSIDELENNNSNRSNKRASDSISGSSLVDQTTIATTVNNRFNNSTITDNTNVNIKEKNVVNYELIDILRNVLIEMATVYRVFSVVENICNNTLHLDDDYPEVNYDNYSSRKYEHPSDRLTKSLDRYLDLKLMDLSVMVNDVTLYHFLVQRNKFAWLKTILKSTQCDWSVFCDGGNRVE